MLKTFLLENYGYNEPIFLNALKIENLSDNALRQSIKRLKASGFIERFDNGIYYIPKRDNLLGKSYLDPFLVIMRKYVRSRSEIYGYVTGISFINQLGLTTQMPAVMEIVTNNEATNGRMVTIGNQRIRIKKPIIDITERNADLLQLLDGIGQIEKYAELNRDKSVETILSYVKGKNFSKEQLSEVASVINGATAKKLIEWGIVYEFAS